MRTLLTMLLVVSAQAADVLPAARRADWTLTGIPGGIPFRTTIYTNLGLSATSDQIEAALAACPSNQVVQLTNGTYIIDEDIRITSNGKTLRGKTNAFGWPTTILRLESGGAGFTQAGIELFGGTYVATDFGSKTTRNITSGLTHGSTNIGLSAAPTGLTVGWQAVIDQLAGAFINDAGGFPNRSGRGISMPVMIEAISGTNVTIWPPLIGNYWDTADDPELMYWDSDVIKMSSIEDIFVDPEDNTGVNNARNIFICNAYRCWVRNVITRNWYTTAGSSGFGFAWTVQCEQRGCYVFDAAAVLSSSYGTYSFVNSYDRHIFNISSNVALVHPNISSQGSAFLYNMCQGPLPYGDASWLPEQWFTHDGFPQYLLYEGNWAHNIFFDDVGNANTAGNVIARNRLLGFFTGKSGNTIPVVVLNNSPDMTIVGNVLGVNGEHTTYSSTTWPVEFRIFAIETDALNVWRTNNYNTVNDAIPAAEDLGALTQQDSYVFASAPTSAYFEWGDRQFPFISPTIHSATNSSYYTNSPAGYRAFFGEWPQAASGGTTPNVVISGRTVISGRITVQ